MLTLEKPRQGMKKQNNILAIFGKKGSGKTFFTKKLLDRKIFGKRILILDSLDEYENADIICEDIQSFSEQLAKHYQDETFIISYVPKDEKVESFFQIVYSCHNVLIVTEELDLFCNSYYIDPYLSRILRYGRHKNISFIGISRRPAEVHRDLITQADALLTFRQNQFREIDFFKRFFPIGSRDAEKIANLKTGEKVLIYNDTDIKL